MIYNSSNINKPKESFNSDERWSTIPPISTNQKKVLTVMVNNSSIINKPKESFNSNGQQFLQYQKTLRNFNSGG